MQAFAELYTALDETTKAGEKVASPQRLGHRGRRNPWLALQRVLRRRRRLCGDGGAAAAGSGRGRSGRSGGSGHAPRSPALPAGIPTRSSASLANWIELRLLPLRDAEEAIQKAELLRAWAELGQAERFLWNKLITGGFRVGISQRLVTKALATVSGVSPTPSASPTPWRASRPASVTRPGGRPSGSRTASAPCWRAGVTRL